MEHERWGQVPVVVTSAVAELEHVRRVVHEVLGAPARPDRVVAVSEVPLLSSGKPDRTAVRALASERP